MKFLTRAFPKPVNYLALFFSFALLAACAQQGGPALAPTAAAPVRGLSIVNPLYVPAGNRLLLHDVGSVSGSWKTLAASDSGSVVLKNSRSETLKLSVEVINSRLFKLPNGERTLTLKPGQSYKLLVRFAPSGPLAKGVYAGSLELSAGGQRTSFRLGALYMQRPEGGNEVPLAYLVNRTFEYTTNLGANRAGGLTSASPSSPRAGEEVRAPYWRAADGSQPILIVQIAAFHSCCKDRVPLQLFAKGSSSPFATTRHGANYGQTLFPRKDGSSGLNMLKLETSSSFELRVDGYSSDPKRGVGRGNLGLRFWPLRNADGKKVPDRYLMAMDYVQGGCGSVSNANCDYNDNVYILKNVRPAN